MPIKLSSSTVSIRLDQIAPFPREHEANAIGFLKTYLRCWIQLLHLRFSQVAKLSKSHSDWINSS